MINKVSMSNIKTLNQVKAAQTQPNLSETTNPITQSNAKLSSKAVRQNALNNISFGINRSGFVVENLQVTIPNIFNIKKDFWIPKTGAGRQNSELFVYTGYNPQKKTQEYRVSAGFNNDTPLFLSKYDGAKKLPKVNVSAGKFAPISTITDTEIGIKIQVLPGASFKIPDLFEAVNVGSVKTGEDKKDISFKGKKAEAQVVVFTNQERVHKAAQKYIENKFYNRVESGDFVDLIAKDKPTFMVLAGGYGTRLFDYTDSKPAAVLPTDPNYPLMGNAFDQIAKSNLLNDTNPQFTYLAGQKGLVAENVKENIQDKNLGDGGCIAKSLALGHTPTDVPLIVLNADTITNSDITRAYDAFKRNPDAAILIPYYESPKSRISGFGLMEAVPQDNGTLEIKSFVEKPKTQEAAAPAKIAGKDKWMANPGIYILGTAALKELKKIGEKLLKEPKEVGLAAKFVTPTVKKCQKGEFKDENGTPLKCYTAPLEKKGGGAAFWDDLGSSVTIPETFRYMAKETEQYGADSPENIFYGLPEFLLNDAVKNVDLKTGVTFMNQAAREKLAKFEEKYGAAIMEGNCIVYDSAS